jgi:hypothetical protein
MEFDCKSKFNQKDNKEITEFNNNKDNKPDSIHKRRICIKLNSKIHKEAANLISDKFSNADEYLKLDKNLIIGKSAYNYNFKDISLLKQHQIIGKMDDILKVNSKEIENSQLQLMDDNKTYLPKQSPSIISSKFSAKKTRNSPLKGYSNASILESKEANMVKVSDEQLEKLFYERKIKTADPNNKKILNKEIYKNINTCCTNEMKGILNKQEKILNIKEKRENEVNNLSKFVAKKVQKNEKELLMNKTDGFRIKNKCIESINLYEESKPFNFGDFNHWRFSLRQTPGKSIKKKTISDKNKILRKDYFLTHLYNKEINNVNEIGAVVYPCLIKGNDENIIKPNSACLMDFRKYANTRVISSKLRIMNINFESFIKGNSLNVKFF